MSGIGCEVCILGGGPAGSVVAIRLARLGHDVVLVDRPAWQPRVESLAPSIAPLLDSVGLRSLVERAAFCREERAFLIWDSDEIEEKHLPEPALLVQRARLDGLLRAAAVEAGVRLIERHARAPQRRPRGGWLVAVKGREETVGARFFVDARGRRAGAVTPNARPRTAALSATWSDCALAETRIEAGSDEWLWGSPLAPRGYVATVFVDARRAAGLGVQARTSLYRHLVSRSRLLVGLQHGAMTGKVSVRDATPGARCDVIGEDFICVGDAAGAIDPLSSQGVQAAILSAVRASAAVHTMLSGADGGPALQFYRERQRDAAAQASRNAARLYRSGSRNRPGAFWASRSQGAESAPRRSRPDFDIGRLLPRALQVSPQVRVVSAPVLSGDLITGAPAIEHPGLAQPVAFVGGVALVDLLRDLAPGSTAEQIMRQWCRRLRPEAARNVMHWMHASGLLVAR